MLTEKTKSFKSYDHKFNKAAAGMGPATRYHFWIHYLRASVRRPGLTYAEFRKMYFNRPKVA